MPLRWDQVTQFHRACALRRDILAISIFIYAKGSSKQIVLSRLQSTLAITLGGGLGLVLDFIRRMRSTSGARMKDSFQWLGLTLPQAILLGVERHRQNFGVAW